MNLSSSAIGYLVIGMLAFAAAPLSAHAQSGPPPQPLPGNRDIQEPIFPPGPWGTCLVGCPREPATPWIEETTYFCVDACEALALVNYDCSALDLNGWLNEHAWTVCPEGSLRGCCHPGQPCAGEILPACCLDEFCEYLRAKCQCERLAEINPSPPAANSCDLNHDGVVNCADLDTLLGGLTVTPNCPDSDQWMLDASCCFLSKIQAECGTVWTPSAAGVTVCSDIRACVETRLFRPLTADELLHLITCYGGDITECACCKTAPSGTSYYSCEAALVCDRNGDGKVDCLDIKQLLEDSKTLCNAGADLKDDEKLDIACVFVAACTPPTAPECQAFLAMVIDCMEDELCRSLTLDEVTALTACTESCVFAGCCSEAGGWSCGESFRCDRANCDGVIDCADITAFVAESEAGCNAGVPYTREQRIALVCEFFEHCGASAGSDICADLKACLEGILGGALTPAEKATLAACTGCDDLCAPNDGEAQPKPTEGDPGCDGKGARGSGPGGTDAAYGDVTRKDNDLVVDAAGSALAIDREYTSDPAFESGCGNAEAWTNSATVHVNDEQAGIVRIMDGALGATTVVTTGSGPWPLPGPTSRILNQATASVDGSSVNVWRITDPGRTVTDFYRTAMSADFRLAALNGLQVQTQDPNGNIHRYDYAFYGLNNPQPRLRRIFVNGSATELAAGNTPDALVEFNWISGGSDAGRLSAVEVFRFNGTHAVLTQRATYTYFNPTKHHADVGTLGDLVQVITAERVDPVVTLGNAPTTTASWRHRVTQYRYHRTSGSSSGVPDRYTWSGGDHQIKFVIEPEQFESLAQRLAATEQSTSATPILYDVDHFAPAVLSMSDSHLVWAMDNNEDGVIDANENVPLVDFATMVAESYETTAERRIVNIYSAADGGCGSCGTQGAQGSRLTYIYTDRDADPTVAETVKVEERLHNASGTGYEIAPYRSFWLEYYRPGGASPSSVPYLHSSAVEDPTATTRRWVTLFDHNAATRTLKAEYTPASISAYTPGTSTTTPIYTYAASGLVRVFTYTKDNRLSRRARSDGAPTFAAGGACTDCELLEETLYGTGAGNTRKYLIGEQRRYRKDPSAPGFDPSSDVEATKFSYAFHGGSGDDIAWAKTEVEAELVSENGPGTPAWYASYEFYDTRGDNVWSVAADDSITARSFEQGNAGQLVKLVRNAPNTMPASIEGLSTVSFGRNADGGALETNYTRDLLGRVRAVTEPGGVSSYTIRNMFGHPDRPGIRYLCETSLPSVVNAENGQYAQSATVSWSTATGQEFATSGYRPGVGGYEFAPQASSQSGYPVLLRRYTLAEELSRRIVRQDVAGHIKTVMEWNALTGPPPANPNDPSLSLDGPNNGVHVTLFEHDRLGRPLWTINANGTAQRSSYDLLDRIISTEVGIANTTEWIPDEATMTVVARNYYDSNGTTTTGVGNGNLTRIDQLMDASTTRSTVLKYDWRDRRLSTVNPLAPHTWMEYDNLDRVVKQATFTAEPTAIDAPLNNGANYRGRYTETSYSQRGLVYRQAVATDPKSANPAFLESHSWFEQTGRPVGTWSPNGPAQKVSYDGLGRTKVSYATDRRGDPLPGAAGNFAAVFNLATHEANVSDDVVLEQASTRYILDRGLTDLITRRQRTHDADSADLGALDAIGFPANKAIATYSGAWYDSANRPIRETQFGTNSTGFQSGGTAPTINQASPPPANAADATRLVTETRYDPRGLVETVTDPMGRVTRFHYDALGRRIMLVENFDAANPLVFHWETATAPPGEYVNQQQWVVTSGLDFDQPDRNRATSFVFDGLGNLVRQTAYLVEQDTTNPGPPPEVIDRIAMQETAYLYGVSPNSGSSISSNDLLARLFYPDSDREVTHLGPIAAPQPIRFAYNSQAEVVSMRDANETEHAYTRDALGRVTLDRATVSTAMPNFQVDGSVNAMASEFDALGRIDTTRSYTNYGAAGQAVRNAVGFTYNDLSQVTSIAQQHDGDINASSPAVGTSYDIQPMASGNRARQAAVTYPDGWSLATNYGSTGSIDDRISRTRDLRDATNAGVYAQYDYIGGSTPAIVNYSIPNIALSRFIAHNGTTSTGTYPGLDRYGRIATQLWVDADFGPHATDPSVPNKPPIVETAYTYDNASSRTGAFDARPGSVQPLSQSYSYDGLHRLKNAIRGLWNRSLTTPSVTQTRNSQQWSLDPLGNWNSIATDLNGSGIFDANETETRDYQDASLTPPTNRVNELFERTLAPDTGGGVVDLSYDFVGNLLRQELRAGGALRYTHDAWNRLVKVEYEDAQQQVHPRAEYEYNPLTWRTVERADTTLVDATHVLNDMRVNLYDAAWRLLESRIDNNYNPQAPAPSFDEYAQHVWGLRYIDDIVSTRRDLDPTAHDGAEITVFHATDAQFSSVAVILDNGDLLERVAYTAYGFARHQWQADANGDGAVDAADMSIVLSCYGPITSANYKSEADFNRDGIIDSADLAPVLVFLPALPEGTLSAPSVGNRVGYCGYRFAPVTETYLARNRWYEPTLGRWIERDPAGYVDGINLYEYVRSAAVNGTDARGLITDEMLELRNPRHVREIREMYNSTTSSSDHCLTNCQIGCPTMRSPEQVACVNRCKALCGCPNTTCAPKGEVVWGPPHTIPGESAVGIAVNLIGEDPACCAEFGIVQFVRYSHLWSDGIWEIDDGRVGLLSEPSPSPPYYDRPVAIRGARGSASITFADAPASFYAQFWEFKIVALCTAGPAAGHIYGMYYWQVGTGYLTGVWNGPSFARIAPSTVSSELPSLLRDRCCARKKK